MTKQTIAIIGIIILLCITGAIIYTTRTGPATPSITQTKATSPKNATYTINGERVTLMDGVSKTPSVPGSASETITTYFGNEATHDLDGDGRLDTAFILTQSTGGSGTFYYVVVALNTVDGYKGSDGILLGDRIAPQSTQMSQNKSQNNVIIVNYADRKAGESFAVAPSVGKSIWVLLDPQTMQLGEVTQNFEGEADPGRMTLSMHTWNWIQTQYNDNTTVTPRTPQKFTLTFKTGGTFSATTDCNNLSGTYTVAGNKVSFSKTTSTLMYCNDSQEADYAKMLGQVQSYLFTSKGELVLDLKLDTGSMMFR